MKMWKLKPEHIYILNSKEARATYDKQHYIDNQEAMKVNSASYKINNKEAVAIYDKQYYINNIESEKLKKNIELTTKTKHICILKKL